MSSDQPPAAGLEGPSAGDPVVYGPVDHFDWVGNDPPWSPPTVCIRTREWLVRHGGDRWTLFRARDVAHEVIGRTDGTPRGDSESVPPMEAAVWLLGNGIPLPAGPPPALGAPTSELTHAGAGEPDRLTRALAATVGGRWSRVPGVVRVYAPRTRATRPTPSAHPRPRPRDPCPVRLGTEGEPARVLSVDVGPLEGSTYRAVKTLVDAYHTPKGGLTRKELNKNSTQRDARRRLQELCSEAHTPHYHLWRQVIRFIDKRGGTKSRGLLYRLANPGRTT